MGTRHGATRAPFGASPLAGALHDRRGAPARPGFEGLSDREREILDLSLQGHCAKAVAYELGIAYSTVRVFMARVIAKTGTRSWREVLEKSRRCAADAG
jgi:DNA-binding NarL/FixJ family response regulator